MAFNGRGWQQWLQMLSMGDPALGRDVAALPNPVRPDGGHHRGWFARLQEAIVWRLRRGGKATSMAQNVAFRTMAMAVNIGTSLLTAAVLGPSGRGEQAALVIAPSFLSGLASLGLHGALIYNLKADPTQERELIGNSLVLALFTGSLATITGWIIEPYWLSHYSPHTIMVGRLLMLVTPMIVVCWNLVGAAEAHGWFGLVNRLMYLQSLPTLLLLGVLTLLHRLTPTTSAFAYVLPIIGTSLYMFVQMMRRLRPIFRMQRSLIQRLLRYGMRLSGVDVLGTISGYIDQLIIVAFLPSSMVGIYAVALSSARLLNVVQGGISAVLFPSVAARETATIVQTVATAFRIATLLIASLAGVLALVAPQLLLLAYGTKFFAAIMPFRVLLLAMVAETGARILYQIYSGDGRPELVTLFECSAVVISILLMVALVPNFGTLGAAIAVLCASSFRMLAAISGLPLLLKIELPQLVVGRMDLRMIRAILVRPPAMTPAPVPEAPGLGTPP